jgi:tetratricopeptide (TPR) repeat protein
VKRTGLILGLLLAAALTGYAAYQQRTQSLSYQLAQARAAVGARRGSAVLERRAEAYADQAEVLFLCARQLRLEGQCGRALARLQRAAALGHPAPAVERELLLLRAQTEFRQVEASLQALLDRNPDDREVLLELALGTSRLRNLDRAEVLLRPLLEQQPADGAALCIRGRIRLQKHQPHEARPDLEEALRLGAELYYGADARLLLANCLLELGKFEEALARFRQCQAEEPGDPRALFGAGRCAWHLARWDEAAQAFQEVLRLRPDHLDALSELAYIHEERGELTRALELLERAAQLDPTWHDLYFRMAKLFLAAGQTERAAEYRQRAEELKKRWAKPRSSSAAGRNFYTGEEPPTLRSLLEH